MPQPLDLDAIVKMPRAEDIDTLVAEVRRFRAVVARIRQMTDHWEQQLPEVIRTPAVVSALRAALESAPATAQPATEKPDAPWSVEYHQFGPARLNPAVCVCGLGSDAVVHNEPPHQCSSRPQAAYHVPVAGLCTLCHHHENAACHTASSSQQQPAGAEEV